MSKIGVIANQHSKSFSRDEHQLSALVEKYQGVSSLKVSASLQQTVGLLNEFKDENIDVLAIYGGDGTICQTLTRLIKVYQEARLPMIHLLGGGTVNIVKTNLKTRSNPVAELKKILEASQNQRRLETQELSTLFVEGHHGFLFSDIGSCTFLQRHYKNKSGAIGVCLLFLRYFISWITFGKMFYRDFETEKIEVRFLNESETKKHLLPNCNMNFVSTLKRMPFRFRFFSEPSRDKPLQMLNFSMRPFFMPFVLPLILFIKKNGAPVFSKKIESRRFEIRYSKSKVISLDGELLNLKSQNVVIETGRKIQVVTL